jgi:phosphate transport system permease protein
MFRSLTWFAAAACVAALGSLAAALVQGAAPALNWITFTTPTVGATGGLANALVGTLWLQLLTLSAMVPISIGTATFAVEYAGPRARNAVLLATDVLAGVPSIVFGYVGYLAFVLAFGWGFSALAAALTLTMVVMPYMIRNTAQALQAMPRETREAALALGWTRARVLWHLVWPAAVPGMATGALLALSVAMGETAPLLYTAEWSQLYPSLGLTHHSVAYLTYMVWEYSQQPFPQSVALAYVAGFTLMVLVCAASILARVRGGTLVRGSANLARQTGDASIVDRG